MTVVVTLLLLFQCGNLVNGYTSEIIQEACEFLTWRDATVCPRHQWTPTPWGGYSLPGDCDMCQSGLTLLVHTLTCTNYRRYVASVLLDHHHGLCSQREMKAARECRDDVRLMIELCAQKVIPRVLSRRRTCRRLPQCFRSTVISTDVPQKAQQKWDCDSCVGGITLAANFLSDPTTVRRATHWLVGEGYCQHDEGTCGSKVRRAFKKVLMNFVSLLRFNTVQMCQNALRVCT